MNKLPECCKVCDHIDKKQLLCLFYQFDLKAIKVTSETVNGTIVFKDGNEFFVFNINHRRHPGCKIEKTINDQLTIGVGPESEVVLPIDTYTTPIENRPLYIDGLEPSGRNSYSTIWGANVAFASTIGNIKLIREGQHHYQINSINTVTDDICCLVNDNKKPYNEVNNLYSIAYTARGDKIKVNSFFFLEFWILYDTTNKISNLMCNVPEYAYMEKNIVELESKKVNIEIPNGFQQSVTIPVCRMIFKKTKNSWEWKQTIDLRRQKTVCAPKHIGLIHTNSTEHDTSCDNKQCDNYSLNSLYNCTLYTAKNLFLHTCDKYLAPEISTIHVDFTKSDYEDKNGDILHSQRKKTEQFRIGDNDAFFGKESDAHLRFDGSSTLLKTKQKSPFIVIPNRTKELPYPKEREHGFDCIEKKCQFYDTDNTWNCNKPQITTKNGPVYLTCVDYEPSMQFKLCKDEPTKKMSIKSDDEDKHLKDIGNSVRDNIDPETGLNQTELKVINSLMKAYENFLKLERQAPDELSDFVRGIHTCQDLLALRIVRRLHPKGWPVKTKNKAIRELNGSLKDITKILNRSIINIGNVGKKIVEEFNNIHNR